MENRVLHESRIIGWNDNFEGGIERFDKGWAGFDVGPPGQGFSHCNLGVGCDFIEKCICKTVLSQTSVRLKNL